MRIHKLVVIVALSTGCTAYVDDPGSEECAAGADCEMKISDVSVAKDDPAEQPDVCELAAQLGSDDICSLICDPSAMAQRMVDDGSDRGACYQLYCALTAERHVMVGVCLPP